MAKDDRLGEVSDFAMNVSRAFAECGWTTVPKTVHLPAGPGLWICSSPKAGDPNWAAEIIRDITTVLKDDGIVVVDRSGRINDSPLPEGCIEINIGNRPTG